MCSKEVAGTTGLTRFYSLHEWSPAKDTQLVSAWCENPAQLRTLIVDAATPFSRDMWAVVLHGDVIAPTHIVVKGFCDCKIVLVVHFAFAFCLFSARLMRPIHFRTRKT